MSAFYHSLGLLQNDSCNFDVAFSRLVEGAGDNLCLYGSSHICYLLGTFVYEQHNQVSLWVIGGNGICNVLHKNGLTSLGLSYNQCALSLTNGGKKINYTCRHSVVHSVAKLEFLIGEEGREVLKRTAVSYYIGVTAVNCLNLYEGEVFLAFTWRSYGTFDYVTGFQSVLTDNL